MTSAYKEPKLAAIIKGNEPTLTTDFVRPDGIKEVTVCAESGLLPNDACPQRRKEIFPADNVPTKVSDIHHIIKVPKPHEAPRPDPNAPTDAAGKPTALVQTDPQDTYCIPDSSWPPDQLEFEAILRLPAGVAGLGRSAGPSSASQPTLCALCAADAHALSVAQRRANPDG